MRPIEIRVKWLPGGNVAVTLWPIILYTPLATRSTRIHELYHWYQALRWGVIPWYVLYLLVGIAYIGKPANHHPLERPAYEAQWRYEAEHPDSVHTPV